MWTPSPLCLTSTRCHSCDKCSQAFLVFDRSSASVYYTECKLKNKKRGRLVDEARSKVCKNCWEPFVTSLYGSTAQSSILVEVLLWCHLGCVDSLIPMLPHFYLLQFVFTILGIHMRMMPRASRMRVERAEQLSEILHCWF